MRLQVGTMVQRAFFAFVLPGAFVWHPVGEMCSCLRCPLLFSNRHEHTSVKTHEMSYMRQNAQHVRVYAMNVLGAALGTDGQNELALSVHEAQLPIYQHLGPQWIGDVLTAKTNIACFFPASKKSGSFSTRSSSITSASCQDDWSLKSSAAF